MTLGGAGAGAGGGGRDMKTGGGGQAGWQALQGAFAESRNVSAVSIVWLITAWRGLDVFELYCVC